MQNLSRRDVLRISGTLGVGGFAGCTDLRGRSGSVEHTVESVPTTGDRQPELQVFDDLMREFVTEHDIPGGVVGVASHGGHDELSQVRGYGYRNRERTDPMTPGTLLRIASLSKAFTRAAIRKLIREGAIQSSQPAFPLLDLDPLPGEAYNPNLDTITIGQLLNHQGGWDRETAYDPLFVQIDIALERGWDEPPTEEQLLRYMLGEPLQFEPGERRAYSNLGYLVLGKVIEAVTGKPYREYLRTDLFDPHGITDVYPGRSLPEDRPDRETWYFDEMVCRNVAEMKPTELVACPDGGFNQETLTASGGHVVTARAFLSFMGRYWLDGRPRRVGERQHRTYNGTLPGTFSKAIQYRGVDVVVIFNSRGYDPNFHSIRTDLMDAIESFES